MLPLLRIRLGVVPAVRLSLGLSILQTDALSFPREFCVRVLAASYLGHLAKSTVSF